MKNNKNQTFLKRFLYISINQINNWLKYDIIIFIYKKKNPLILKKILFIINI